MYSNNIHRTGQIKTRRPLPPLESSLANRPTPTTSPPPLSNPQSSTPIITNCRRPPTPSVVGVHPQVHSQPQARKSREEPRLRVTGRFHTVDIRVASPITASIQRPISPSTRLIHKLARHLHRQEFTITEPTWGELTASGSPTHRRTHVELACTRKTPKRCPRAWTRRKSPLWTRAWKTWSRRPPSRALSLWGEGTRRAPTWDLPVVIQITQSGTGMGWLLSRAWMSPRSAAFKTRPLRMLASKATWIRHVWLISRFATKTQVHPKIQMALWRSLPR